MSSVELAKPKEGLENYPPSQKFINRVGGPDVLIPKKHELPLTMRVQMAELAYGLEIGPLEEDPKIASLLRWLDSFSSYVPGESERKYKRGGQATENAIPAKQFFQQSCLGPGAIKEMKETISDFTQTAATKFLEQCECDASTIQRLLSQESMIQSTREIYSWLATTLAKKVVVEVMEKLLARQLKKSLAFWLVKN